MIGKKVNGKPRFSRGPVTYQVFATVNAGQLCSIGTAGNATKVGPSAANANTLGVATTPAFPAGTSATGTSSSGYPNIDLSMPDNETALARKGAFYLLATGTIACQDFVKCGAAGSVVKWDPTVDQNIPQVGQCIDTDGATNGLPVLIDLNIQG